jgi:hypothetical protein
MQYEGWIPNATGNISFSAIGDSLGKVEVRQQFTDGNKRWILCVQKRSNPDTWLYPWVLRSANWIANLLRKPANRRIRYDKLTYVMTAVSSKIANKDESKIEGKIFILNPTPSFLKKSADIYTNQSLKMKEAARAIRYGQNNASIEADWSNFESSFSTNSIFECSYTLLRNGKCFIDELPGTVHNSVSKYLSDQCYYYLKDCIHNHYHHHNKTDAIIEITPKITGNNWRYSVIRSLYRKVIYIRKLQNHQVLNDALGLLAYADSFKDIFENKDYTKSGKSVIRSALPKYNQSLEYSIKLVSDKLKEKKSERIIHSQFTLATFLSIFALFISIGENFSSGSRGEKVYDLIKGYIQINPEILLWAFITIIGTYYNYIGINNANVGIERATYKLFAWMKHRTYIKVGFTTSIVILFASYYLLSFVANIPLLDHGYIRPEVVAIFEKYISMVPLKLSWLK